MPVGTCTEDGRPGYRCGRSGKCYTYAPGDEPGRKEAKRKAAVQCVAIGEDPGLSADGEALALEPTEVRWVSDIAFEGMATDDGRYIVPGALEWRDLPLTLMAMTVTSEGGHEGAYVAGRIDKITRSNRYMNGDPLPDGVTAIRGEGVFDIQGDNGAEIARLVNDETVRGISIDMAVMEARPRDPESGELLDEADLADVMAGDVQLAVTKGSIMAATVCPTPAFAEARIAIAASSGARTLTVTSSFQVGVEALTAGAAGLAPLKPPRDWFELPEADRPTPLTVTADGQVFGHMALWESCHTGFPGSCVPPPHSPSGYAFFNLGEIECKDGSRVPVGAITLESLHASLDKGAHAAKAHYDNTAVVAAHVKASDGALGIWVAGALRPGLSEEHARDLMGAKPSGDWRQAKTGGPLEMIGIHAVNVPGFPVPRMVASALLPSGGRAQLVFWDEAALERKVAVLAARAEGGIEALADLAGV